MESTIRENRARGILKLLTVLVLIGLAGCIALFIPSVRSAIIALGDMAKIQILHRPIPLDAVKWNRWLTECAGAGTFFLSVVLLYCNTRIFERFNLLLQQSIQIGNSDEGSASIAGFCNFCKKNVPLVLAVTLALFFTYGIKLFWYTVGIDAEGFLANKASFLNWNVSIGRFGLGVLQRLWYIAEFNPFNSFFTAFCLIWFFTLSWCYIIAIFTRKSGRNNALIPFALIFMTSPVWAEQFYFVFQAAETSLMIGLCPYVICLLYKGFLDNEKKEIAAAVLLLLLMISVYQAIVPLFCCGVFACFLLLQESSDYEPKVYRHLCLKLFASLAAALAVYCIIDRIILPFVFHIGKSDYVDNMSHWGKRPVKENLISIASSAFRIVTTDSRSMGSPLLASVALVFLIKMIGIARKNISGGRRLLYILAGIGVPLCTIILTLTGGGNLPIRSLYALPFAYAFMFFFLITACKKVAACIVALALLSAVYQAEITAQLFYSDYTRYNEDVRFSYELNNMIREVQPEEENLSVALIGRRKIYPLFKTNFIQGEVIGHSIFEWASKPSDTTSRGLAFMRSLGINYEPPEDGQLEQALNAARTIPAYPDQDCVKRIDDMIVVRISETLYE